MSIIDKYISQSTISEVHQRVIPASVKQTYKIVRSFQFANSIVTDILFAVRGLSNKKASLQSVLDAGFIFLEEEAEREFVLGLVGKFWTPGGCLQKLSPIEFIEFRRQGFVKAAWNFSFEKINQNETLLTTETRVLCLDDDSRRKFKMYWFFIRAFSGIIRREMLRSIQRSAIKKT